MSKQSDFVKNWRKRTKQRIIDAFGGICCICKNKYPPEVYDLHHVDGTKDFQIGQVRATCKSWEKLVVELRKCALTCSNCHRSLHYNYVILPNDIIRFNEDYATYPPLRDSTNKTYNKCQICGKDCVNKYCSYKCSHLGSRKVLIRPDKNDLIKLSLFLGYESTGRLYGVSGNMIKRWIIEP